MKAGDAMVPVSILTAVYNAEKFLPRLFDSLARQTCAPAEIVAVDDGSTDGSAEMLETYAAPSGRIAARGTSLKIVRQKNSGVAAARDRALREATCRYVMFVDDDDWFDRDYIEKFYNEALRTGADIVCGGYRRTTGKRQLYEIKAIDKTWTPLVIVPAWAKIYRRDMLARAGIEFLKYGMAEDIFFVFSAYKAASSIAVLNYTGYNWFFNPDSISNTRQRGFRDDIDPVYVMDRLASITGVNGRYAYFFVRYAVWYLLFAGRAVNREEFIQQDKRLFAWLLSHGIPLKWNVFGGLFRGDTFRNRAAVPAYLLIRRLGLVGLFTRVWCKGRGGS